MTRLKMLRILMIVRIVGFVPILYMLAVRTGQMRLMHKADDYDFRANRIMDKPTQTAFDYCETDRFLKAEGQAVADMGFDVFREFTHWNTDYLARQPRCKDGAQ